MTDWLQEYSEGLGDLAENETLKQYKSATDAFKALVETKKMVGGMIKIPGEDAGEEAMRAFSEKLTKVPGVVHIPEKDDAEGVAAFRKKLGVPDDPDGYTVPEDFTIDQERFDAIKKAAHARGINNDQLIGMMETDAKWQQTKTAAQTQAQKAAADELKKEWGVDYERRVANAVGIAQKKGGEDFNKFLEANPAIQSDPQFLKIFEKFSRDYVEDNGTISGSAPINGLPTPGEAQQQLAEIRNNPAHPYNYPNMNAAKKAAIRKVIALQAAASGQPVDKDALDVVDRL